MPIPSTLEAYSSTSRQVAVLGLLRKPGCFRPSVASSRQHFFNVVYSRVVVSAKATTSLMPPDSSI